MSEGTQTTLNPIATEIFERGQELVQKCADDKSTYDIVGGAAMVDELLVRQRNSLVAHNESLLFVLREIELAVYCGFMCGIAAMQRSREIDEQMRALGVE